MFNRLIVSLLAIAFTAALAGPAQAADSISVSFGPDPMEEVPLAITANWSPADPNGEVFVTVKPAGGVGCGATFAADDPTSSTLIDEYASAGKATAYKTFNDPGTFILCGYYQTGADATVVRAATGPVPVTVRQAKASVSIVAPAQVDPGQAFTLTAQTTTELQRTVFVTYKPAGGRPCEPTFAAEDPESSTLIDTYVQGTDTATETITAPQTNGTYLLCAYVGEGESDPTPEAVASSQFLVGPTPCQIAQRAQKKAASATRVAEKAATRYRRAYQRDATKAARTSGSARRHWQALYQRDHSRYRSAIRRRAKKRAALVTANNAAAQACAGR